jgi:glutamate 5-kinase
MQQTSPRSTLIVIKLGTSSICDEKTFIPKLSNLSLLVETVVELRNLGHRVVLVTSGAVGVGLRRLGLPKRPKHLSQVQVDFDIIQAVAAVGQGRLMALYDSLFSQFGVPIGQILLTRDNLSEVSSNSW